VEKDPSIARERSLSALCRIGMTDLRKFYMPHWGDRFWSIESKPAIPYA
jgi:hypothetical protein